MMIILQKNHNNYHVYIIAHLYGSVSYNHEKVNFTRTEISLSTKVKLRRTEWMLSTELNLISILNTKVHEKYIHFISI